MVLRRKWGLTCVDALMTSGYLALRLSVETPLGSTSLALVCNALAAATTTTRQLRSLLPYGGKRDANRESQSWLSAAAVANLGHANVRKPARKEVLTYP
jgi:hypothetical protein